MDALIKLQEEIDRLRALDNTSHTGGPKIWDLLHHSVSTQADKVRLLAQKLTEIDREAAGDN